MLICVAIIKSGVTMVCINKRSSDCAIFDVYIAMISMLRVYLFLLFDFSVCLYHKFIIYACRLCEPFRLLLYERRKFLIIIFQWCSINGNANLSRRKEKQLTVFTTKTCSNTHTPVKFTLICMLKTILNNMDKCKFEVNE